MGESQKTSVKVHHNPGGQSNWSLGWGDEEKPKTASTNLWINIVQKYHNESNIVFGGQNEDISEEE